ncbi:MAG: ribosome biogenesis GTPase Der, partial [Parachlamydiaceae bacterium]
PRNAPKDEVKDDSIKIAIVGRPNVGKSSLVNAFLEEERCIVSPIAGTTRDSVDTLYKVDDELYTLIDTAGIRKKSKEKEVVEKYAALRVEKAIERSQICLLVLDANQGITAEEKKIATDIERAGKGCILLLNKWDTVKGFRMEHCLKGIEEEVPFLKHCPTLFISALTRRNLDKIIPMVKKVYEDSRIRIPTGQLNRFIEGCLKRNSPPMIHGKRLRIYYMAQVAVEPPKFVVFVNYPDLMSVSYKKYLYNQFREDFSFSGVPIELYLRGKEKADPNEDHVG